MIARPVLRAHQLRSVGPGQRWLVEVELTSDGRIHQRVNEGTPEPVKPWTVVGTWTDLDVERRRLTTDGWDLDQAKGTGLRRASMGTVRILAIFAAFGLVVACAPPPADRAGGSQSADRTIALGSPTTAEANDASARTACVTRVLTAFVRAFNSADTAALEQTIAAGPLRTQGFQWVSMSTSNEGGPSATGPRPTEVEYTPEGARRLLLRHAEQGERWKLVSARAGDGPSWHGGVDAEVHFERTLANGTVVRTGGKTALSCIASAIYVLSLGDDAP